MVYKVVEVLVKDEFQEEISKIANRKEVINIWKIKNQNNYCKYSFILEEKNVEMIVDSISKVLGFDKEIRDTDGITDTLIIYPIEGFLPKVKSIEQEKFLAKQSKKAVDRISTEEIYDEILNDVKLSQNYLLNIILASIVCSVGIIKLDVAILIAASAIAPFLGSIIGYSFSISIGDNFLMKKSLQTLFFGLAVSIFIGVIIGSVWSYLPNTYMIGIDTGIFKEMTYSHYAFILALASGASAGLAITTGTPTIMASFMVSVALLPNITITGITLGNGSYKLFLNSFILLFINLICIIFTSQLTFALKKVRPKTKEAVGVSKNNNIRNIIFCVLILAVLVSIKIFVGVTNF